MQKQKLRNQTCGVENAATAVIFASASLAAATPAFVLFVALRFLQEI